jgi:phage terminase small subunit
MYTKRGTKSAEDLAAGPLFPDADHPPPAQLSEAEAKVWRDTVQAMKPGWFNRASAPLLEAYCTVVVSVRTLAERLRAAGSTPDLADIIAHERAIKTMESLATKLRLTPLSNRAGVYDGRNAPSTRLKPWDPAGLDDASGRPVQPYEL